MQLIVLALAANWAVLLGAAYITRVVLRLSKYRSALMVAAAYLACAGSAIAWLGLSPAGLLGAFGLLLPLAAALLLVFLPSTMSTPPR